MANHLPASGQADGSGQQLVYDKWLVIDEHNQKLQLLWLAVMYQMDAGYQLESVDSLSAWICRRGDLGSRAYYYGGQNYELAIRFDYSVSQGQFTVASAGFAGDISVQAALDELVELAISFTHDEDVKRLNPKAIRTCILAIHPKKMDNPRILELYDRLRHHPRLIATVENETESSVRLRLCLRE